ncbi:hypothetical protein DV515_00002551, partial [Chloebia gouldiae]
MCPVTTEIHLQHCLHSCTDYSFFSKMKSRPWQEDPRPWKCSKDPMVVSQQDGLEPEAVRAQLEHVWDAKWRNLMCSLLESHTA